MSKLRPAFFALAPAVLAAACGAAAPSPTPAPSLTPAPATPSPSNAPSLGLSGLVATFQVGDEQYRILLTDAADIAIAQRLLSGDDTAPRIPNGLIVRGETSVNEGWTWSIDPESLEFADMTTEVCDGLPSYVEDGSLTGDYFCPWSAELIDLSAA